MKVLLSSVVFLSISHAQEVTLSDILQNTEQKKLLSQRISEEGLALASKNLADTEIDPLTFNQSIARANGIGISGYQHEISFSKNFKLGNIQELEQQQNRLNNEAYLLEQEKSLLTFDSRLANLYHQHCLGRAYVNSFEETLANFSELYAKKQRAYEQDEIAKTELLQLEFEKNRLQSTLDNLRAKSQNAQQQILSLTSLNLSDRLSCQDIYPIKAEVHLSSDAFKLSQEAYNKRISSTQVGLKRYSQKLESIEVSMGYANELDMDIYTVGVSIPLNLSTRKSEYERASLMHQSSAITLQNEQYLLNKKQKIQALEAELKRRVANIEAQEQNIAYYSSSVLPLMKKSYDYGESTIIEYLLTQQKLTTLQQELLEKQKAYYQTLFQLYSMSETKEIN